MEEFSDAVASVRDLEEAVTLIFQNNFDADSQTCLITLMKILDNIIHKPGDTKVRTIRLQNATFANKVGSRKGGVEFLLACGFQRGTTPPPLLSESSQGEEQLVLQDERQSHLITARRLLQTRAVQDLSMNPDRLPVYRPPPVLQQTGSSGNSSNSNAAGGAFNPYAGHRYDAKSAAVGANLGPDANYVSKTETELHRLQQRQAKLEGKLQTKLEDPGWRAFAPGQEIPVADRKPSAKMTTSAGKSDSSLLAERLKRQQQERLQREQGGFTTKAMRDLERIKKQKVYSHTTLTIQFPDGSKLQGHFLQKAKIKDIVQSLQDDCLITKNDLDLYVTPPRRLLTGTLQQEGLVPAAKVFVSWKTSVPTTPFLRPELYNKVPGIATVFPASQAIAAAPASSQKPQSSKDEPKPKKKKESREEAMLRRMMGKKPTL